MILILCHHIMLLMPLVLCYIPAYKAVFLKDKYLQYFKQFEKEDEHWHKKWKRRTIDVHLGGYCIIFPGVRPILCHFRC